MNRFSHRSKMLSYLFITMGVNKQNDIMVLNVEKGEVINISLGKAVEVFSKLTNFRCMIHFFFLECTKVLNMKVNIKCYSSFFCCICQAFYAFLIGFHR